MTNKEYKALREQAENANELYTFESYNGWYTTRYMQPDDLKEMRAEYREIKKNNAAFALDDFGNRALIIPTNNGYILKSYYTEVAEIRDGKFIKLWGGYSATTLKHINAFRKHYGFLTISKREWIELKEGIEYAAFNEGDVIAQKLFAVLVLDYQAPAIESLNLPAVVGCRVLIDGYFHSRFTAENIEKAIEHFNNNDWRF